MSLGHAVSPLQPFGGRYQLALCHEVITWDAQSSSNTHFDTTGEQNGP